MTSRNQCQSLITSRARKKAASLEEQELVLISLMRTVEISASLSAQLVKNTKAKLMPITAQRLAFPANLSLSAVPWPGFLFMCSLTFSHTDSRPGSLRKQMGQRGNQWCKKKSLGSEMSSQIVATLGWPPFQMALERQCPSLGQEYRGHNAPSRGHNTVAGPSVCCISHGLLATGGHQAPPIFSMLL